MSRQEPLSHSALSRIRTEHYGHYEHQVGDLYLPANAKPAVVCLLHGGFWRMPYGRDQMEAIAQDLILRGFAVWNLEYRRLGDPTGGWPNTGNDVIHGIEYLSSFVAQGVDLDLQRIAVVGHSAGGHLALWAAAQMPRKAGSVSIKTVVGAAPVTDLQAAFRLELGRGAVAELMGATPDNQPESYAAASPVNLLPLGVPQLVIQGSHDAAVPIEMARDYVAAAKAAGDVATLTELPDADHMAFLDPASSAHREICAWLSLNLGHCA